MLHEAGPGGSRDGRLARGRPRWEGRARAYDDCMRPNAILEPRVTTSQRASPRPEARGSLSVVTGSPEAVYDTRVADALAFAAEKFACRTRKGTTTPYLSHLLAVTALVMEHGGTTDQAVAAILHDYLEDIPGASVEELRARFGDNVARLVRALSDAEDAEHKPPWRERKEAYLAKLAGEAPDVKLISAADKLHNTTTLLRDLRAHGTSTFERFKGKRDGTLWYHREVVAALRQGFSHPILDALEDIVRAVDAECGGVSPEAFPTASIPPPALRDSGPPRGGGGTGPATSY